MQKVFAAFGAKRRGCVKRFFLALRAKLSLDGDIFFLILLRKIRKKMSPSKEYFAAAGGENLFSQPHNPNIIWGEAP
ncbi:MAG: hypothetical protein ACOYOO_03125 [Saprospiraceae bacterium]